MKPARGGPSPCLPEGTPQAPPPPPSAATPFQGLWSMGFCMDVVVTGVVDECIFFGKDGTKNGKEETVCLTVSPDDNEGTADTSLCRLYRHVSHDFLEIRFKIQRLLEPRQYMLLLPEHVLVKIFSSCPPGPWSPSRAPATSSRASWKLSVFGPQTRAGAQTPSIAVTLVSSAARDGEGREGRVSLCHCRPKPYHHDLP
ncbi:F-box only protein 46 [Myotis davidii]|uniref:F-box only protein 46 n=1 Tax=Myotis davidii TaxID=225400 RepID=L5LUN6_MYODS|nr:F-box only protein 46 [Myotis davidii]